MRKTLIAIMLLTGLFLFAEDPMKTMNDVDKELMSIASQAKDAKTLDATIELLEGLTRQMSRFAFATMDLQKQMADTQTIPDSLDTMLQRFAVNMQKSMSGIEAAVRKYEKEPRMKRAIANYRSEMGKLDRIMRDALEATENEMPEQE